MPRLSFSSIYATIEDITNINNKRNLVKRSVQIALDRITSGWNWPYLMQENFFTLVAPYETGTVSVTNGNKTVTGDGTTFTSAMVGRKIRVNNEDAYYRIGAFVSTTEVTLEVAYGGDTATAQSYSIFKDEYRLAPNCDKYKIMRHIEDGYPLIGMQASAFDILVPTPTAEGGPRFEVFSGTKEDTYITGTVAGSGTTLTGTNTVWASVEGLGKGTRIKVSSQVLTVKSVASDTSITVYETISPDITAGTTHTVVLDNLIVQVYDIPDAAENIYYRHQRKTAPLVGDTDLPDMPAEWFWLLIEGALSIVWPVKDKDRAEIAEIRFKAGLADMKRVLGHPSQHQQYPRKEIDDMSRYPLGPSLPGNIGIVIPR